MFIRTQDKRNIINLNNVTNIGVEIEIGYSELYAYLLKDTDGCKWIRIGKFQDKDSAMDELNLIQDWIDKPTKKNVYEVTGGSEW